MNFLFFASILLFPTVSHLCKPGMWLYRWSAVWIRLRDEKWRNESPMNWQKNERRRALATQRHRRPMFNRTSIWIDIDQLTNWLLFDQNVRQSKRKAEINACNWCNANLNCREEKKFEDRKKTEKKLNLLFIYYFFKMSFRFRCVGWWFVDRCRVFNWIFVDAFKVSIWWGRWHILNAIRVDFFKPHLPLLLHRRRRLHFVDFKRKFIQLQSHIFTFIDCNLCTWRTWVHRCRGSHRNDDNGDNSARIASKVSANSQQNYRRPCGSPILSSESL